MKGERHRLSPQPQVNFHKLFVRNRLGKLTCLKPSEISIMLISFKKSHVVTSFVSFMYGVDFFWGGGGKDNPTISLLCVQNGLAG
jgi:hypothetical protein